MDRAVKTMLIGNWALTACFVCYLLWWLITFRPPEMHGTPLGRAFLLLAFVLGIGGITQLVRGSFQTPEQIVHPGLSPLYILLLTIALYLGLLWISVHVFQRQVTSELVIILFWGMLEAIFLNRCYETGTLSGQIILALVISVLLCVILSLVCYILYYRLPYTAGYIDGCVPLVLGILVTAAISLCAARAV